MKEYAFAKVNLHLDVLGKRADGYHDIGTIFQTIHIFDTLTFDTSKDNLIQIDGVDGVTSSLEDNLIYKAAVSLRNYAIEMKIPNASSRGAKISVEKVLPMGAGLGGGSADAAAALRGLNKLWDFQLDYEALEEIGIPLGADVPFMVQGGTSLARGIGEKLKQVSPPEDFFVLVVTPSDFVSTATAYAELNPRGYEDFENFAQLYELNDRSKISSSKFLDKLYFNHFEETVFRKHPEIMRLKNWMIENGAKKSLLSGSGASVFGLFSTEKQANAALDQVSDSFEGIRFKKVTFFEKNPLKA